MNVFILLPNNLFDRNSLIDNRLFENQYNKIYLWEEESFFKKFVNPQKTAYLRTCMKIHFNYLKQNVHRNTIVEYLDCTSTHKFKNILSKENITDITFFDPIDHNISSFYDSLDKKIKKTRLDNPIFLLKQNDITEFFKKYNKKNISNRKFFQYFANKYKWKYVDKSYDEQNRSRIDVDYIPQSNPMYESQSLNKYYTQAIMYASKLHKVKPDSIDMNVLKCYPITHDECIIRLELFLRDKFKTYGKYQDAIHISDPWLYHSITSVGLNIGLITPKYIYERLCAFVKNKEDSIGMNNIEGFLRQLLGWREFMRYIYMVNSEKELISSNHWKNKNKLNWDYWNGKKKTGIEILDKELEKCIKLGWAHHIVRLMVFLNIFVLCNVQPTEIYKWFMQHCGMDAYPWVMLSNIWTMGYFITKYTHKPYISTSNYINQMSNYPKKDDTWDALFYSFLITKKDNIKQTIYSRNLKYIESYPQTKRNEMINTAKQFIKKVTI